ncbi:MAG: preprotein translocase subunit SecG, partial [Phycisphaerae bacterium]|nr:preprotein translocase subunit SecG [Phycisphaerae bacterium]
MMLAAAWYHNILAVLFAFVAVLLILIILLQRGKGVGLAGAFGGSGGSSAFGAKTGDFLTWVTVVMAIVFLAFAVVLNYVFQPPKLSDGADASPAEQAPPPEARYIVPSDERPLFASSIV